MPRAARGDPRVCPQPACPRPGIQPSPGAGAGREAGPALVRGGRWSRCGGSDGGRCARRDSAGALTQPRCRHGGRSGCRRSRCGGIHGHGSQQRPLRRGRPRPCCPGPLQTPRTPGPRGGAVTRRPRGEEPPPPRSAPAIAKLSARSRSPPPPPSHLAPGLSPRPRPAAGDAGRSCGPAASTAGSRGCRPAREDGSERRGAAGGSGAGAHVPAGPAGP